MADQPPIPVICDRCAARGDTADDLFARFGDLLDFEPVPRKKQRADGWTPEVQRYYIAALALTGSERQAARAVGKAQFGVTQLKRAEGNDSFMDAHAKAMAFYGEEQGRRLSEGLQTAATHATHRSAHPPPWSGAASRRPGRPANAHFRRPEIQPDPEPELTEEEREERHLQVLESIYSKFILKVQAERQARLEGHIVAADHYCRQLTSIEVFLDLGDPGWEFRERIAREGFDLVDIAATIWTQILDEARREKWAELGEPQRPPPPSHDELVEQEGFYTTEGESFTTTGDIEDVYRWQRDLAEKHRRAAEAQVAWEAEALRDYERRRERGVDHNQEPGSAGQPAP